MNLMRKINVENLIYETEISLLNKEFKKGLSCYTQANCTVTLTDKGLRIYRPANLTVANDGNTMWGGLKIQPYNIANKDVLIKGHTYVIKMHIEGKSSNACTSIGWSNNMGWGEGGLNPSPSNVAYLVNSSNFDGEMESFYRFTINDDVNKVCTTSYSSFVSGKTYLSYRDYMYGFGYESTGELGTDLYITNLRLYDITDVKNYASVKKSGIVKCNPYEYEQSNPKMTKDNEFIANDFYEY